jgi:predicted RNA-binding Zn ribbon-like protein
METPSSVVFEISGGHPALDFVNTVGGNRQVRPREDLRRFSDLVAWATQAGLLRESEAKALAKEAAASPAEAEKALVRARTFREAVYRLLFALLESQPPAPQDVAALEAEVHRALSLRRLTASGPGFAWTAPTVALLDTVVPRVAVAASELVTSEAMRRVRICEAKVSEECSWLFLDETRNHSRRWCNMATCGNQHKARRHYARVRAKRRKA